MLWCVIWLKPMSVYITWLTQYREATYWMRVTAVPPAENVREKQNFHNADSFAPGTRHEHTVAQEMMRTRGWGGVHTHQQSRVESNPVHSYSQRRGSDPVAYLQWQPRQCVHTSGVESSRVTRVLPSQESWCRMSHFRQSDSSVRARWLLSWGRNGCGKAYSFSYGPRCNLRPLALWTPEPRLTLMMMMFITTKTTAPLTTVIMFLLLLGLLFKVCIRYFGVIESDNRLSIGFKLQIV